MSSHNSGLIASNTLSVPGPPTLDDAYNFISRFFSAAEETHSALEEWRVWHDQDWTDSLIEFFLVLGGYPEQNQRGWFHARFRIIHTLARHGRGPVLDWRAKKCDNAHQAAFRSASDLYRKIKTSLRLGESQRDDLFLASRKALSASLAPPKAPPIGRYSLRMKRFDAPSWIQEQFNIARPLILKILEQGPLPDLEAELFSEYIEALSIQSLASKDSVGQGNASNKSGTAGHPGSIPESIAAKLSAVFPDRGIPMKSAASTSDGPAKEVREPLEAKRPNWDVVVINPHDIAGPIVDALKGLPHNRETGSVGARADTKKKKADKSLANETSDELLTDQEKGSTICMIAGGFVYRKHKENLVGKPWCVLNELVKSKTKRVTAADLLRSQTGIWPIDSLATTENVRDAIEVARAALRKALGAAKVKNPPRDPIPCVDRGPNLAWELTMP
jgi:hypothetical protein